MGRGPGRSPRKPRAGPGDCSTFQHSPHQVLVRFGSNRAPGLLLGPVSREEALPEVGKLSSQLDLVQLWGHPAGSFVPGLSARS